MFPADVAPRLREMAETFRGHAQESVAIAYERSAALIEEALARESDAPLTLQEAAELSGYSTDHLGRLVREGRSAGLLRISYRLQRGQQEPGGDPVAHQVGLLSHHRWGDLRCCRQ